MNQLKFGIKTEMEHKGLAKQICRYTKTHGRLPSDKHVAEIIAKEHIKEDKNYYTKLKKAKL